MQEIRTHEKKQGNCYVLVGDFNARILKGDGLNPENFGKYFLKSDRQIHEINKDVWDNRERFVEFVHDNELAVISIMFKKRSRNLCTIQKKWRPGRKCLRHHKLCPSIPHPNRTTLEKRNL